MSRTRQKQIVIRMTETEFARVKKQIAASGLKQQEYLIRAILNKPIINTEGMKELIPQLKKLGTNLNQMTRLANAGFPIDTGELASMREELSKQWLLLKQYTQKRN
jgi:hypothetical protein